MADQHSLCVLTVMDRLWFDEIILFSPDSSSSNPLLHLPNLTHLQQQEQTPPQENPISHHSSEEEEEEKRRTRTNKLSTTRSRRSHSSSIMRRSSSMRAVEVYSMSCRSLRSELEMEEVKGFMDLGFNFNKENISPRMASVVPGLLRLNFKFLESSDSDKFNDDEEDEDENEDEDSDIVRDEEEEEDDDEKGIMRPYLSEAWLIRRPNSPLLNLKLPRGDSADSDMKKHLKFWAKTVATHVIHQDS
ncbi:uncharacterized protein [Euphorbia lathyris]|uniref:uncharacterized protein n=1 Tax=Euphorbia lathyris TaxID=212925 RepID=UPI0033138EAB